MKKLILTLVVICQLTAGAQTIQDFTLVNVADSKSISLSSFQSCQGIAVIFFSNECPYDGKYLSRIRQLNDRYKGSIQFVLVNSHSDEREGVKAMSAKYKTWQLSIPYLADKDQVAMECMGSRKSPEAFLVKKNGNNFSIAYSGAIDDNPLVESDVNQPYLQRAIDELLAGKKITVNSSRAAGCTIRGKVK